MTKQYQKTIRISAKFAGQTVKEYLKGCFVPKHLRGYLRQTRGIHVNGSLVATSYQLQAGDNLVLTLPAEAFGDQQGPYPANFGCQLTIAYEDEDVIVINKSAGMKMHPHSPGENDTLLNYANAYLQGRHCLSAGQPAQALMVHRLDRATSGLVMVAKNPLAVPILNRLIKEKIIVRTYLAQVAGLLTEQTGVFQDKIGDHPNQPYLRWVNPAGQEAVTIYQVLKADPVRQESLVRLQLLTGRMHQLRVHLAANSHPIKGDTYYNGQPASRLALHSASLSLVLPFTGKRVVIEAWLDW